MWIRIPEIRSVPIFAEIRSVPFSRRGTRQGPGAGAPALVPHASLAAETREALPSSVRLTPQERRNVQVLVVPEIGRDHAVTNRTRRATGVGRSLEVRVVVAERTGDAAATTIDDAERMLGDAVSVYLDAGTSPGGVASTILDVTAATPRVLRDGPIGLDVLHRFNNTIEAGG